jgi:hypothetical protein
VHTDGNALIPAVLMAMTKGDDAAVPAAGLPVARLRPGLLDGTKRPMIMVPQM